MFTTRCLWAELLENVSYPQQRYDPCCEFVVLDQRRVCQVGDTMRLEQAAGAGLVPTPTERRFSTAATGNYLNQ